MFVYSALKARYRYDSTAWGEFASKIPPPRVVVILTRLLPVIVLKPVLQSFVTSLGMADTVRAMQTMANMIAATYLVLNQQLPKIIVEYLTAHM